MEFSLKFFNSTPKSKKKGMILNLRQVVLITCTVIAIMVFSIIEYITVESFQSSVRNVTKIESLKSDILLYDEVLTNSAKMMALTGESEWINKYFKVEQMLAKTILEAYDVLPTQISDETIKITDAANDILVRLEKKSFLLSQDGDTKAAYKILTSNEYKEQKAVYLQGVNSLVKELDKIRRETFDKNVSQTVFLSLLRVFCLMGIFFVWCIYFKRKDDQNVIKVPNLHS